jgi:hypothetical protein
MPGVPPPHPPWLHAPVARWRIRASDAAFFLVLLTGVGGTSAWSLRWIPPVMTWLEPLRLLTQPGHTAALVLEGHAPSDAVILMTWPWAGPCILINALLLWGPMLALRSPRVPPVPIAAWVGLALLATAILHLATAWSPSA